MKKRSKRLRKEVFERNNYTCQKCRIKDESLNILEAHHIKPLFKGGEDELANLITLCKDGHHFSPNKKEEFKKVQEKLK